jgi:mannose-6-phosphate isomerase-like protein (cupin superfamily)
MAIGMRSMPYACISAAWGGKIISCRRSFFMEITMTTQTSFLRRDPAEVTPWAETCGAIRCLIEESDGAAAEVHHVEIDNAKLHYHARTDEIYYVIDGEGSMVLDDEEIELHQGVVVYVPRGVKHKAVGKLTVLTVCIPRGVLDDVHEVE